ncbi:hypothetical protein BB560_004607 [Smittium megazygosporum]|uniref:VPS10 domain-containing protein n=1 Tax=Smittium megazygosporum TaxID=133381 RepID=A0A2T9Z8S0_9FUNG|nr:hypothetical protein BB560_004607 [Smittium megazygosporum]
MILLSRNFKPYLIFIFLFLTFQCSSQEPKVYKNYFDGPFTQLYHFEETTSVFAIDGVSGVAYQSQNSGVSWEKISDFKVKPRLIYLHPTEKKRLYVITDEKTHYYTEDGAKTWKSFEVPLKPYTKGGDILSFNAAKPDYVLYNGANCKESFSFFGRRIVCRPEYYYTKTNFNLSNSKDSSAKIQDLFNTSKNLVKCMWLSENPSFQGSSPDTIACILADNSPISEILLNKFGSKVIVSDNFFESETTVKLGNDNVDRIIMGLTLANRFAVIGAYKKTKNDMDIFVTVDGVNWHEGILELPKDIFEQSYTVLESTKNSLFVDVKLDNMGGVLYRSDVNGTYFTKSIDFTSRTLSGIVDIERINGIEGIILVNIIDTEKSTMFRPKTKTKISFNDGSSWEFINPPQKNANGKEYSCPKSGIATGECSLHLHSVTSTKNPGYIFSVASAPGVLVGVGSVGSFLEEWNKCETFLSTDGGRSWTAINEDAHVYEILGSGSSFVLVNNEGPTDHFHYSIDSGKTWKKRKLDIEIIAKSTSTQTNGSSYSMMVLGHTSKSKKDKKFVVITIDTRVWDNKCELDPSNPKESKDIELWTIPGSTKCIMGSKYTFFRRRENSGCYMPNTTPLTPKSEQCSCTRDDFECDFNFSANSSKECVQISDGVPPSGSCRNGAKTYFASSGYRKIPGNTCKNENSNQALDKLVEKPCPEGAGSSNPEDLPSGEFDISHHETSFSSMSQMLHFNNSNAVLLITRSRELFRSADRGGSWDKIKFPSISDTDKPMVLIPQNYIDGKAYVYFSNNEIMFTEDFGSSWTKLDQLPSPVNQLSISPILSFHATEPKYLLFAGGTPCPNCFSKYYVSHDHGKSWRLLITHAESCAFSFSASFAGFSRDTVVCHSWKHNNEKTDFQDRTRLVRKNNYLQIAAIDSKNPSSIEVLPVGNKGHVSNFYIYSKYLVYSAVIETVDEDANKSSSLELWIMSSKAKKPVKPSFPPNMPPGVLSNGYTFIQTNNGEILLDVEQVPEKEKQKVLSWGTLLLCNEEGTAFQIILDKTNRNSLGNVDVETVEGVKGAIIANKIINTESLGKIGADKQIKTMYSLDGGISWSTFNAPNQENSGSTPCNGCVLNLSGKTTSKEIGGIYGTSSAPGVWMGVGSVGTSADPSSLNSLYISRNAGTDWKKIFNKQVLYEWGNYGGIIAFVENTAPTNVIYYSFDSGEHIYKYEFSEKPYLIRVLTNGLGSESSKFMMIAISDDRLVKIIQVDFSKSKVRKCSVESPSSDFEKWTLQENWNREAGRNKDSKADLCYLGEKTTFSRRKSGVACMIDDNSTDKTRNDSPLANAILFPEKSVCECNYSDYYCDLGFWFDSADRCELVGRDDQQPSSCSSGSKYKGRSGYVKKSFTKCSGGKDLSEPVERVCGEEGGINVSPSVWASDNTDFFYVPNSPVVMSISKSKKLYISSNYGESWTEKDFGSPVEQIILNPSFKDSAIIVTSSEDHYFSTDRGENFQKTRLPVKPHTGLGPAFQFHPNDILTILYMGLPSSCSQDAVSMQSCNAEPYYSENGGQTWNKIKINVGRGGCVFYPKNKDSSKDKNVICSVQDSTKRRTFSIVDTSSNWFRTIESTLSDKALDFVKAGKYIAIAENHEKAWNKLQLRVSVDGKTTALAHFPGNSHDINKSYTILDVEKENGFLTLFATENSFSGNEWGTIFTSNSNGTYFRKSLERANRDSIGLVDFERCAGISGTIIANIVSNYKSLKTSDNHEFSGVHKRSIFEKRFLSSGGKSEKQLKTVLTIDGGSSWRYIVAPAVDSKGKTFPCVSSRYSEEKCSLHLHGFSEVSDPQNIYSSSGAVGTIMGLGNVGDFLQPMEKSDLFLSRDGGYSWSEVRKGPHFYEFADHGALLVIAPSTGHTDYIEYSLDSGSTWKKLKLKYPSSIAESSKISIMSLTTEPTGSSRDLLLVGKVKTDDSKPQDGTNVVFNLDFSGAEPRQCVFDPLDEPSGRNQDDFELWSVNTDRGKVAFGSHTSYENGCVLGARVKYFRKIPSKRCFVGKEFVQIPRVVERCACTRADFECDFNFYSFEKGGRCKLIEGFSPIKTICGPNSAYFNTSSGYRLIPDSQCDISNSNSLKLDRPVEVWCPGEAQRVASIAKLADAVRNINMFRRRYRHMLPQHGIREDIDEDGEGEYSFDASSSTRFGNAGQMYPDSILDSAWDATKYSLSISYDVIAYAVRESLMFGSSFLPARYRRIVQSYAPLGPISFPLEEDIETLTHNNTSYNFNVVDDFDSEIEFDPNEMFKHEDSDDSNDESDVIFNKKSVDEENDSEEDDKH